MIPSLAVLLAVCLAEGEVRSPDGEAIAGAVILDAATGRQVGVTSDAGLFRVELPDAREGSSAVLEFRSVEHAPRVERFRCGDTDLHVTMQPRVFELDEVEVSATRLERRFEASPARTEAMGEREVADAAGALPTVSEAIQQLPGLGAIGRDGLTSAPTIRGFARDRSIVLVEGMRLSSDRGIGATASFVDPFLVRRVDVVRGASGVAYGSGAIGGVVSVGTGATTAERTASARLAGSTNGDGKLVAGRASSPLGREWRGLAGAFFRSRQDYAFPGDADLSAGDAVNSGFEQGGGIAVLERKLSGGKLRAALLGTTADEIGRPTTRPRRRDTIEREDHVLGTVRFLEDADGRRTELGAGLHRPHTVNRAERFDAADERTRTGRTENVSWDVYASALRERPRGGGSWFAGADLFARTGVDATETNEFTTGGSLDSTATLRLLENGRRFDLGAFAGWKRPVRWVGSLLLAARLDWAARGADERTSVSWLAPSATAGIVVPLDARWDVTGSLSHSFRAPRIQELYFEGDRPAGSRLANPDLDPERAWSLEGGVRWHRGPWTGELALWGLLARDLIVQLPVSAGSDTLQSVNEDEGRYGGAEVALGWAPHDGHAKAGFGWAWMRGRNRDGEALPDVPSGVARLTGSLRVLGDTSGRSVTVRGALRAGGAKAPVPNASGETWEGVDEKWWSPVVGSSPVGGDEEGHPGFVRWDLGLRVRAASRIVLDLSISNLLDARYIDRAEPDAFPQPGRAASLELTIGE